MIGDREGGKRGNTQSDLVLLPLLLFINRCSSLVDIDAVVD